MKALLQLPAVAKDGMFSIIVGRPWPNARQLTSTWNKVAESADGRRYALDLDRTRDRAGGNLPAHADFNALFSQQGGYANYYNLIESLSNAVPVLRLGHFGSRDFLTQAEHIHRVDRGLVVRLEHGLVQDALAVVDATYQVLQVGNDVNFVIDAGWAPRDLLSHEVWAASIVGRIIQHQPEAEIVIAGSSFPDQFDRLGKRGVINVAERRLYAAVKRRFNAANLVYGDWGSTRPSRESTPMINVPRIDLPNRNDWVAFRRDNDADEDYMSIARRVMQDSVWPRDLNIWGTYMITSTAQSLPEGIRSAGTAAAVRVNIHLHQQRFFDTPGIVSDGDEPYTDL